MYHLSAPTLKKRKMVDLPSPKALSPQFGSPPTVTKLKPLREASGGIGKSGSPAQKKRKATDTMEGDSPEPETESTTPLRRRKSATSSSEKITILQAQLQPVELKGPLNHDTIQNFESYLIACGNSNVSVNRNNLIDKKNKIQISQILEALDLCSGNAWEDWPNIKFFEALRTIFPKSNDQTPFESIENQIRKTKMLFNLEVGAKSLLNFTGNIGSIIQNATEEGSLSSERSKGLIKVLLQLFPDDETHRYLRNLMHEGGLPTTVPDYLNKLLKASVRLHKSFVDIKACGRTTTVTRTEKPKHPQKSSTTSKEQYQASKAMLSTSYTTNNTSTGGGGCKGCGKKHSGECFFRTHPDFNHSNKPWLESLPGKAWKEKGESSLPVNKPSLKGITWHRPEKSGNILNMLNDYDNDQHTNPASFPASIVTNNQHDIINIDVLLDTGALQGNYVSEEIARQLEALGANSCTCMKNVCTALKNGKCQISNKIYSFTLKFFNELTNEKININIKAVKLNMVHDLIIGIPTIREYDMLTIFAHRFRIANRRLARELGPLGHVSSSDIIPSTIANIRQSNIKQKTELLTIEPDMDDLETYFQDAPWEMNSDDTPVDWLPRIEGSPMIYKKK